MPRPEPAEVHASAVVIMLFLVAPFFASSWLQISLARSGYAAALAKDLSFFALLPTAAMLMWPVMRQNVAAIRHWFRPPVSWWRLIAYSVLLGVLLRIIFWASITAGVGFGWFHNGNYPTVAIARFSYACPAPQALVLALLVRTILTPVFEEFIHRGFVLHALLPRGNTPAIALSAVFFGVMHNPQTIAPAILIGLLLAVMTLNLGSLWGPIIVHATFNLVAFLDWECLHATWNPNEATPRLALIGGVAALTVVIFTALLIWLARRGKAGTRLAPRP